MLLVSTPTIRRLATRFRALRINAGVDFYLVDMGIRYNHADFGGLAAFVGGVYGAGGIDDNWHCAAVASCLAGAAVGIAREAALRIVKRLSSGNTASVARIAACIGTVRDDYLARAGTNRPAVLNLSLTANGATEASAVADCIDAGIVVVAFATNGKSDAVPVPASVADVICVGGIKANDTPYYDGAYGTNFGPRVDNLAASEQVWTACNAADDGFWLAGGTSFGTPLAAGAVACMLQGKSRRLNSHLKSPIGDQEIPRL